MDSLLPALIAALLAHAVDRPPWLVAILSDRYARPFQLLLAILLAQAAANVIAAVGALAVAPSLSPNARSMLLGIALVWAAGATVARPRSPADRLEGWRLGAFATPFLGLFILIFGDRTQFLAFGFAVAGSSPLLAAVGATIGATIACVPAMLLGERGWARLPLAPLRWIVVALLGIAGVVAIGSALRII